ncbi:MAG: helix-turn-helix domain-containing protein [Halioglobus sp.]|nr:helix-turn-helix domain-containing protein [Halioglobus sp.]
MAQLSALINALKSALRGRGVKYIDVGEALDLSESSVKRRFFRNDFNLAALDAICALASCEISDLVKHMEQQRGQLQRLTAPQEEEDTALLPISVCVLNRRRFDGIQNYFRFDKHELVQKLACLDRPRIIALQPGNRIRLLVDMNFGWLPGGPIENMFLDAIQSDCFHAL